MKNEVFKCSEIQVLDTIPKDLIIGLKFIKNHSFLVGGKFLQSENNPTFKIQFKTGPGLGMACPANRIGYVYEIRKFFQK